MVTIVFQFYCDHFTEKYQLMAVLDAIGVNVAKGVIQGLIIAV